MAKIGLRYFMAAPITDENDGGMPTYGTGVMMGRAMTCDVSWNRNDASIYADDVKAESDNGINGGSITAGSDKFTDEVLSVITSLEKVTGKGTPVYQDTDKPSPKVGFAYLTVDEYNGQVTFVPYFVYKTQFATGDETNATKGETKSYQTPTLTGDFSGVLLENGTIAFREHATFADAAEAIAWMKGKLNVA